MTVKVYVEGGGDHNKALQTQCRKGFSEFFQRSGLKDRMPRIVGCGGRRRAYESFCTSHQNAEPGSFVILLVDSEAPVTADPWEHVRLRGGDGWQRPRGASDEQIHFMVQAMEAWFYADKDSLAEYYGASFRIGALSGRKDIENIPKVDLFSGLERATAACQEKYSKGEHSFKILAKIDPAKVRDSSTYADTLLQVLDLKCQR